MQLRIVPPSTGTQWVKQGLQTFFKQPLALGGLFFIFMAVASVASIIPVLGSVLALVILPGATLGLMVASLEASRGKFPMPSVLAIAFKAGQERLRAMLILGAMYAAGFLLIMAISSLFDGGEFAKLYLVGGRLTPELLNNPDFQTATLVGMGLYMPLSLLFWHAPALVHWHGVSPVKAIFFSMVACWRNKGAFLVFGMAWMAIFSFAGIVVMMLAALLGMPAAGGALMMGVALITAAMFFSSLYFTFRDSFVHDDVPTDDPSTAQK